MTPPTQNKSLLKKGLIALAGLLIFLWINPWSYNDPTQYTVVTQGDGHQFAEFGSGVFYAGLFAHEKEYPNQVGVQYNAAAPNLVLEDNTIDIGQEQVSFLGGATATLQGIVQYNMPRDEKTAIEIHNTHGSIEGFVNRRLAPYTKECLASSAQLMAPEQHYNGGKSQMAQEYLDQLRNGCYLLESDKVTTYDSTTKENKTEYVVRKQVNKANVPLRKFSSIKQYGITIGDAQITGCAYEKRIVDMLGKQIDAQSASSVAKQQYLTAQQQALTAKAQGEKDLVTIEYNQKKEQTKQVVAAQTKVALAEQTKLEEKTLAEAAEFESKRIRIQADANAYQNRQLVSAGLTPGDKAEYEMKTKIGVAEALSKLQLPNTYISGGNGSTQNDLLNAILSAKFLDDKK